MRAFDRDLIRGGHYGQRSRQPRSKAEHMAAPTNTALVKKVLANSEPSTHGPSRQSRRYNSLVVIGGMGMRRSPEGSVAVDPSLTWGSPRLLHCTPIIQMR